MGLGSSAATKLCFSTGRSIFLPLPTGTLGNVQTFLDVTTGGGVMGDVTGIQWGETRDTAKHPTMHRTALTAENYQTPNIKSSRLRNPDLNQDPSGSWAGRSLESTGKGEPPSRLLRSQARPHPLPSVGSQGVYLNEAMIRWSYQNCIQLINTFTTSTSFGGDICDLDLRFFTSVRSSQTAPLPHRPCSQ